MDARAGRPGGRWRPITALWGVNVELHLPAPPRHALEEAGIDALLAAGGGEDALFALVTAGRVSSLGATFLADEPDAAARAPRLRERGARFVPVLGEHADRLRARLRAAALARTAGRCWAARGDRVRRGGPRAVGHLARARPRRGWWPTRAGARAGDPGGARRRALLGSAGAATPPVAGVAASCGLAARARRPVARGRAVARATRGDARPEPSATAHRPSYPT